MARPERPVEGGGPVTDLARALRQLREQAGNPGYRQLSDATSYSRETLAAAARGKECPSWDVAKAFANACDPTGRAARGLYHLWEKASLTGRKRRAPARRRPQAAGRRAPAREAALPAPRPDPAGTAAQYVYQLRALRAWAGNPGWKVIYARSRAGYRLTSSTMYDALSPKRTTLPQLDVVMGIVSACLPGDEDAGEWADAWRSIALHEFTRANPRPAGQAGESARPPLRVVSG